MARKKKHEEHVNHERWLISYADFITLLFAFFVVMFASSQVDAKKMGRFTESFSKAVGIEVFPTSGTAIIGGEEALITEEKVKEKSNDMLPEELESLRTALVERAKGDADVGGVKVLARQHELVLRLADTMIFDSGNDHMTDASRKVLRVIAGELKSRAVSIRIEGHTDDRPIATARFPSNWELSTARAMAVIRELAGGKIEPDRLSAAGYAQFHPIADNTTPEGRAQNRRVDLVISPLLPGSAVPLSGHDAGSAVERDASPERSAAPEHEK